MPSNLFTPRAVGAAALLAFAGLAAPVRADAPPDLPGALSSLRAAPMTSVSTLAVSREGRDIPLITLGDPASRERNPALLIVAGLNGDHTVGVDLALGLAKSLVDNHADALAHTTVYIVPCANPDAAAARAHGPRMSRERTTTPVDNDRDRRLDEDGPEDLNGDGVITQMRVRNPPPHLRATHILDPDNEGLLREADSSKGEVAEYALLTEGLDNDNDGRFNEDGAGAHAGVDLNMNFPHLWPELEASGAAGAFPLSEPESLALVKFVLDTPSLAAVLVLGPHDTLVSTPQAGKNDVTGRAPLGVENTDKPHYDRLSKAFKDITGMTGVPSSLDRDDRGAFWSWAYAQGGMWSFSTPGWTRPDLAKRADEQKPDDDTPDAADAQPDERPQRAAPPTGRGPRGGQGGPGARPGGSGASSGASSGNSSADDAKWLAYAKERGEGFINWTSFNHPQLGEVEIGGFVPAFRTNPPPDDVPRLVDEQTRFVRTLLDDLPRVEFDAPVVEKVGDGVFRVAVVARNTGKLPTASAIAVKARTKAPVVLRLEGDEKSLLAGRRVQRAEAIPGGGFERFEWLVSGREGSPVTITVRSPQTGEQSISTALRASKKEGAR